MADALLFDSTDCGLSDITIRIKGDENVKAYHAHKAILANRSKLFHKLFAGDTGIQILELEDDSLHHFDLLMKYFYHDDVSHPVEGALKEMEDTIAVYCLAAKYESKGIMAAAFTNFSAATSKYNYLEAFEKKSLVAAHYSLYSGPDSPMGRAIVKWLVQCERSRYGGQFINHSECSELIDKYAEFARDLVVVSREHKFQLF